MAVRDRATTVEEDILLVDSIQHGLKSRGYVPGPLVIDPHCGVNREHPIMHPQRWMREAVGGWGKDVPAGATELPRLQLVVRA